MTIFENCLKVKPSLKTGKEQNMQGFTKAASFLKSFIEKEKILKYLEYAQENIEKELKNMYSLGKDILLFMIVYFRLLCKGNLNIRYT